MDHLSILAPRLFRCGAPIFQLRRPDFSVAAPQLVGRGAPICRLRRPDCAVGAPQLNCWGAPIQLLGCRTFQLPPANIQKNTTYRTKSSYIL